MRGVIKSSWLQLCLTLLLLNCVMGLSVLRSAQAWTAPDDALEALAEEASEEDLLEAPRSWPLMATEEANRDAVKSLPGMSTREHNKRRMFSGYIPVDGPGRALFYFLVESDKGFKKAPLILWTNGGPGCSGFLGFLTEQGPFRPSRAGKCEPNPYAWTKLANMVFIEQPVGVGFSKTSTPMREVYNDANAAKDNYRFILNFFERYPEFKTSEFYISSESYGGHYMPTLAKEIVDRGGVPNFKGFLVGNPLTSGATRDYGEFMTFQGQQLLPKPMTEAYAKANCRLNPYTLECLRLAGESRALTQGLDPYGLNFPVCHVRAQKVALLKALGLLHEGGDDELLRTGNPDFQSEMDVSRRRSLQYFPDKYEPCQESYATAWLNRRDVQTALHVDHQSFSRKKTWSGCNNFINIAYNRTDVQADMVPIYQHLIKKAKLKIWIFSGDDDSVCATASDQEWIWSFPASSRWSPWHVDGQVSGYNVHFKGFSYFTVHGAGHMVPSTRPKQALELLKRFLAF